MALWGTSLVMLLALYGVGRALLIRPPQGGSRRSLAHWRWPVGLLALSGVGWTLAIGLSEQLAFREYAQPDILDGELAAQEALPYQWAVVIGRRPERSHRDDEQMPYRNSPIALYHRMARAEWEKRHGDLLCRSTTTTAEPPQVDDVEAVVSFSTERNVSYRWGHVSVPPGLYNLSPAPWRTGDTAFLISTLHGSDGTIALEEPQVLTVARVATDELTGQVRVFDDPGEEPVSSYVKEYCYIHPSTTADWSHRDSLGCINLHETDYAEFLSWFEANGLLAERVALVVAPFEDLVSTGHELPGILTLEGL